MTHEGRQQKLSSQHAQTTILTADLIIRSAKETYPFSQFGIDDQTMMIRVNIPLSNGLFSCFHFQWSVPFVLVSMRSNSLVIRGVGSTTLFVYSMPTGPSRSKSKMNRGVKIWKQVFASSPLDPLWFAVLEKGVNLKVKSSPELKMDFNIYMKRKISTSRLH